MDKQYVDSLMRDRGFTRYASMGANVLQFVSAHMYTMNNTKPVVNIIVYLDTDEFKCIYNVPKSINTLESPKCGSFINDKHFFAIANKLTTVATLIEDYYNDNH